MKEYFLETQMPISLIEMTLNSYFCGMPLFQLTDEILFPHASYAEDDGLLAIGGDLSVERILCAYPKGIFPWFNPEDPILWWSPDPRCVLFPGKFKLSKSLRSIIKRNTFKVTFNTCFEKVIEKCASTERPDQPGTWITPEIAAAYTQLHKMGWVHSVETFYEGQLVGGLYGLAIGKIFFGESMFHTHSNASKVALYFLTERLKELNFELIDNQTTTEHLLSLGAEEMPRDVFLEIIQKACGGKEKLIL